MAMISIIYKLEVGNNFYTYKQLFTTKRNDNCLMLDEKYSNTSTYTKIATCIML